MVRVAAYIWGVHNKYSGIFFILILIPKYGTSHLFNNASVSFPYTLLVFWSAHEMRRIYTVVLKIIHTIVTLYRFTESNDFL